MFSEAVEVWFYRFFVVEQKWHFRGLAYPGVQHIFDGTVVFYTKDTAHKLCRLRMGMVLADLKEREKDHLWSSALR